MIYIKKLISLLTEKQKRNAFKLLILMFIGMALETLGVGLILPVITILIESDIVAKYPMISPLMDALGNPSHSRIIVIGMLTLLLVYFIKTIFLVYFAWYQSMFTFRIRTSLSNRLYLQYLNQPYTFHLQRNSAELIRNVTGGTGGVTSVILVMTNIMSEILVIFGILALLLVVEPMGTSLVIVLLSSVLTLFYNYTKKRVHHWGEIQHIHDGGRIKQLQQGLTGIKEVIFMGRQENFISQFEKHNLAGADAQRKMSVMQQLPRFWLELLVILGLVLLVLSMVSQGKPTNELMAALGLFAVSAFRLAPAANRILSSVQKMRYGLPVVNEVFKEINNNSVRKNSLAKKEEFVTDIVLEKVSYNYPGSKKSILSDIDLVIPKGSMVGFIGSSGSGKSTLIDIILGLLMPTQGAVNVNGNDIQKSLRNWQDQIGYVPQNVYLMDDTLRRNIAFGIDDDKIENSAIEKAVNAAQLDELIMEMTDGLDTIVGEHGVRLSGGQRQRIGIARALYHDPNILLLDEATSALDNRTEEDVMQSINALRGVKTIIIIAHRHSTISNCDNVFELKKGKIYKR